MKQSSETVPFLLTNFQTIQINPAADYFLDVDAFMQSEPTQVIPLYRGDLLVDFFLPDSDAFEAWERGDIVAGSTLIFLVL